MYAGRNFPEVIQLLSRTKNNSWVFWICRLESNLLFPTLCSLFPLSSYAKRLHRKVAIHTGNDDVAGSGAQRAVNHKKVAILYSRAYHGIPLHTDEERGGWPLHKKFIQVKRLLLILLRRGWEPRND